MGKKIIYCNINGLYLLEKVFKESDLHLLLGGNVLILRRVKDERGASAYRVRITRGTIVPKPHAEASPTLIKERDVSPLLHDKPHAVSRPTPD